MDIVLGLVSVVRSLRNQLQLPSSMVFTGVLRSDDVSDEFHRLLTVLSDLGRLELSEISPLANAPQGFMTCPVPGSNSYLSLKVEDSQRPEFLHRLERMMKKSEERRTQFLRKAEKYEEIVSRDRKEGK
ncbi:hypothetical protein NECAME_10497, partial [Necator americanus]